jgi:hypothetical protein
MRFLKHFASSIGLTCALAYLAVQLVIAGFVMTAPRADVVFLYLPTMPLGRLAFLIDCSPAFQLTSAIVLAATGWYLVGLVLDRIYYGRPARSPRSST